MSPSPLALMSALGPLQASTVSVQVVHCTTLKALFSLQSWGAPLPWSSLGLVLWAQTFSLP